MKLAGCSVVGLNHCHKGKRGGFLIVSPPVPLFICAKRGIKKEFFCGLEVGTTARMRGDLT
jgi:hypothetical protein